MKNFIKEYWIIFVAAVATIIITFLIFCHNFVAAFILYLLISGLAVVQGKVEEKQIEKKQQCSEESTVAE